MKKTLLMMTVMIFSVVASAKTNVYDFKVFAVGDDGEAYVTRTYNTTMNEDAVNRTIVRKLSGDDGDINKTSSENGVTKYEGQFQTQAYYNPFSGSTKRFLKFNLEVKVAGNTVTLVMTNLKVTEEYIGFGITSKNFNVTDKLVEYNEKRAIYDRSDFRKQPKSVRSEVEDVIDEVSNTIGGSDKELDVRLRAIEESLK